MKREEIFEKLNKIFEEEFEEEDICLNDQTTAEDIEDWDSLAQINLVVKIESVFKVKFKMQEIYSWENVGQMVDMIVEKTS